MPKGDIVAGLDIGTTKVATIIAEVAHEGGRVDILGVGTAPSQGLRRGVVVDMERTIGAILESRDKAQRMAGAEIRSVVVGVTGEHIASVNSKGVIAITHPDRQVTDEDVARVMENSRVIVLPPDRDIIHAIPRGFTLDGQSGIRSPVGMSGTRLEVETHIVTGATTFLRNVAGCVERAGLVIEDMVLEPIATADAVLMNAEKDLGVALVDIGGGTSDIAIYQNGDICWSGVVPVGGVYVTRDIAAGLRASLEEAERIKLEHGTTQLIGAGTGATFTYNHVGSDEEATAKAELLAQIIEPRMHELFTLVRAEINRSNYAGRLPAGMVVSGGGAMLAGARDLAEAITGLPVRIGFPGGVGGLGESVSSPSFATGVGLVQWGGRLHAGSERGETAGGFFAAVREWIRRVLRGA
ncbi:MAG: cell division protein FtsA [Armatimonadetes bacterium]|nr:cell division protein FtsA [Armatimonadota bacterium]